MYFDTGTGVAYANPSSGVDTIRHIQKWPGRMQANEDKVGGVFHNGKIGARSKMIILGSDYCGLSQTSAHAVPLGVYCRHRGNSDSK